MRLTKLEMHGFKSFFHQTTLSFSPGISAVVGPNGCGKSNIADAIRWVMGEQSPSKLRGKSMEDIIFAGTAGARSMGYAEVNLSVARTNGPFPAPFHHYNELTITRRLYRSGESEYLINKAPCRLKDIVNLFMDTGLGARGYAIIEQGSIGRIIDSGPEERRAWIEGAAGIVKFKAQRQAAMRKLESTSHNLERVADILAEVERQARSLNLQAKKAQRYRDYTERIRVLELALAALRYEELTRELNKREAAAKAIGDRRELLLNKETAVSAALEADRLRLAEQERRLADKREQRVRLGSRVQALEQQQGFLKEKGEALKARQERDKIRMAEENSRLDELAKEREGLEGLARDLESELAAGRAERNELDARLDEARELAGAKTKTVSRLKDRLIDLASSRARAHNALISAEERLGGLNARRRRLAEQAEQAEKEREELSAALEHNRARLEEVTSQITELTGQRDELENLRGEAEEDLLEAQTRRDETAQEIRELSGRLAGLTALEEAHEGLDKGVKTLLTDKGLIERLGGRPFLGLVADGVRVGQDLEAAVEAALASAVQHLVAQGRDEILAALESLKSSGRGRAGLISPALLSPAAEPRPAPEGARLLAEAIEFTGPTGQAARAIIGDALVTDDLDAALAVWQADGRRRSVVTLAGEIISPPGVIVGGRKSDSDASLLARQRTIRELKERLKELEAVRAEQDRAVAKVAEQRNLFGEQIVDLTARLRKAEAEQVEAEKESAGLTIRLKELDRLRQVLTAEADSLTAEEERLEATKAEQAELAARAEAEQKELERELTEAEAEAEAAGSRAAELREELTGVKVRLSRLNSQKEQLKSAVERIEGDLARTRERIESLAADLAAAAQERDELDRAGISAEEELKLLTRQVREQEAEIGREQERLSILQEELGERGDELKSLRDQVRGVEEEARQAELALSQTRFNLEHLTEDIAQRYQIDLAESFNQHIDRELDQPAAKEELDDLKSKVQRMGAVNPTAVEEYQALIERKEFLEGQVADLTASMNDLKAAIRKINKTTLERFSETFKAVAAKMEELGPILFGEGAKAQLILTDPDNPLESGVDIKIQPPGKRLTNMGLLSGGEKALAAATLLFAIFLIKPSPFCLLDEVDAPLDEQNVERFNRLVKEIGRHSQILMITHNRRTMESVDTLYGVTMPEPGVSRMVSVRLDSKEETDHLFETAEADRAAQQSQGR